MNDRHCFPSLMLQISLAGILCTLFYLVTLSDKTPGLFFPAILLLYAPLALGVNWLFLRRERPAAVLVLLNGICWVSILFCIRLAVGWSTPREGVVAAIFCLIPTVRAGQLAVKSPKLSGMILNLDVSLASCVLLVGGIALLNAQPHWCLPIAAGSVAAILGLTAFRMNRPLRGREWGILSLVFAGLTGLMLLLLGTLASAAGGGVVALWKKIVAGYRFLVGKLEGFLQYLCSFLTTEKLDAVELEHTAAQTETAEAMNQALHTAGVIVVILFGVLLLALALLALYVFGRVPLMGRRVGRQGSRERRRRISLWQGLKRAFSRLRYRWALGRSLRQHRDTPWGMFFLLERACRRSGLARSPGETPREFLIRLSRQMPEKSGCQGRLEELAEMVQRSLYSAGAAEETVPQAASLRRAVKRAARFSSGRTLLEALRRRAAKGRAVS